MAKIIRLLLPACVINSLILVSSAFACPFCHSETGQEVNRRIFGGDFVINFGISLAPFAVIFILITFFHLGYPSLRTSFDCDARLKTQRTP